MATKKFILAEKDIPQAWYNVIADMPNKPMSPLNPATKSPLAVEDLYPIFAEELCKQELNTSDAWIEIPEEVRDMYKIWRPTPLVRALGKSIGHSCTHLFQERKCKPCWFSQTKFGHTTSLLL